MRNSTTVADHLKVDVALAVAAFGARIGFESLLAVGFWSRILLSYDLGCPRIVSFAFLLSSSGGAAGVEWLVTGTHRFGPVFGLPKLAFHCSKNSTRVTLSLVPRSGRMSQKILVRLSKKETFQRFSSGSNSAYLYLYFFGPSQSYHAHSQCSFAQYLRLIDPIRHLDGDWVDRMEISEKELPGQCRAKQALVDFEGWQI